MSRARSLLPRPLSRAGHAGVRPRALRHVVLIAAGFLLASSGVAYAFFSATSAGTYGLAAAGRLNAPPLSLKSTTATSAVLTWKPPSNPPGTTWQMRETGLAVSAGSCSTADPSPTCTVTGLGPDATYHFNLTYTLHAWHATSNAVTVTTTGVSESCLGGQKTVSLKSDTMYTFTLLGGGGGKGGSTGATGGGGSTVHGSFTTPATSTVKLVYELGCAGTPGKIATGGNGGAGYAAGGHGGRSHTTKGSPGGGGGGGGASDLAVEVGGKITVIAVVGGGGGGGGGTKLTNKNTPQAGVPNTETGKSTAAVTGQNGKTPTENGQGGMGTGAGGGGAGTLAPSGGKGTGPTTTGKTAGKGGTGGYNYKVSSTSVTGVTVTIGAFSTGSNPGQPGSLTLKDPPGGPVSPAVSVAAPTVTGISPATGPLPGGTSVTITGSGFTSTATVSFGSTAASVTVKSTTSIVATSPAHAVGQVDVLVTTPGGTSAKTAADVFTYVTPSSSPPRSSAAPTVTGISPGTGPVTGGTAVAITGTGFTSTATVSFGSSPATSVTVTSTTTLSARAPAHASGAVTVTLTTNAGSATTSFTYTTGTGG